MQKTTTLKQMGIQAWYPRVELPLVKPVITPKVEREESVLCYCYQWEKIGEPVAYLLAEYGEGSTAESDLIAAIAKALPLEHNGSCQELALSDCAGFTKPIFVLGHALFHELGLQPSESVVQASSPAKMLSDQSLKRDTWGKLQKFSLFCSA